VLDLLYISTAVSHAFLIVHDDLVCMKRLSMMMNCVLESQPYPKN
jgi:hypothetical protein